MSSLHDRRSPGRRAGGSERDAKSRRLSHRKRIRGADRIIVLQNGRIIETGRQDQLMAKDGLCAKLYSMNYASFDDIPDKLIQSIVGEDSTT